MRNVFERSDLRRVRHMAALFFIAAIAAAGCDNSGGLSHREQVMLSQQEAADAIAAKGGKAVHHQYPQGEAWIVDLNGLTIDDEIVKHVQSLGKVSEVDLSGSTISDEQITELVDSKALGTLIKLDISDTQVSDAAIVKLADLYLLFDITTTNSNVTSAGIKEYQKNRPKHPLGLALKVTK